MAQRPKHLKKSNDFPKLAKKDHLITSDRDPYYNCIAFAAGITDKKILTKLASGLHVVAWYSACRDT
jgi:hypothetical protein